MNVSVECAYCKKKFDKSIRRYNESVKFNWRFYCSRQCQGSHKKLSKECLCGTCGKVVVKGLAAIKSSKYGLNFCSKSCSVSRSNTFRKGKNNPNFQKGKGNYRTICFLYHEKKCVVCGENKIVTAHHFDEDHKNNDPKNLIPLCPTHHQYWHSRYKSLIENVVCDYQKRYQRLG
jgi:hypothetical protein